MRKIIHIDMDAFYASIEQRDNEALRGKPVAVGYSGSRGVVAAASYEARKFGVRSAMASKTALRKCPHLIFVRARFDVYKNVSKQIMNIFYEYTDLVEPLSLDEAFLDVTENHKNIASATEIAREIKDKIRNETSLTASAGVSYNKFLAKIASDINKPDGLFVIKPAYAEKFVEQLSIERFFGVGKITEKKMIRLGIKNGWDLKQKTEEELVSIFGKAGHIYYNNARAIDNRPVNPNRIRKSIGSENTFNRDIDSIDELKSELIAIAEEVSERVKKHSFTGRTVTLKIKYADFRIITRSKTFNYVISDFQDIYGIACQLLNDIDLTPKVRLMGVTVKSSDNIIWTDGIQLDLDFGE